MRRFALVAAVLAGLAGGGVAAPPAHAQCAFIVVWHDRAYWGFGGGPLQSDGKALEGAVQPGCNDTTGANEQPSSVTARTIPGIPRAVAIFSEGQTLIGSGYLIGTTDLGVGDAAVQIRDETRGCTLGGPVQITGRVHLGFGLVDVSVDDTTVRLHHLIHGSAQVFPDGHTRFDGLTRNGFPYIGEGQRVRVDARFCKVPGSIGNKIVARRIAAAGPIVPPSTAGDVLGDGWAGTPDADAVVAAHGYGWAGAVAVLALAACIGGLVVARRRSTRSGTR
jgi:hypothetical protein